MEFSPKFNMGREDNIFVVKRNIVDYLWKSAHLEGIQATFPQTKEIFEGRSVQGLDVHETLIINNLKRAWSFVLENIDLEMSYSFICEINKIVGEAGVIRNPGLVRRFSVHVGDYVPEVPIESKIKEEISDILTINCATDRALTLMTLCMRRQIFSDGNKRTATLAANQIMVSAGEGIISIPIDKLEEFSEKTIDFYKSNNSLELKKFLYDKCIDGINFE